MNKILFIFKYFSYKQIPGYSGCLGRSIDEADLCVPAVISAHVFPFKGLLGLFWSILIEGAAVGSERYIRFCLILLLKLLYMSQYM